jgi:hypothetical protein
MRHIPGEAHHSCISTLAAVGMRLARSAAFSDSSPTSMCILGTLIFLARHGHRCRPASQYQGRNLDEQLDDMSPAALDHQREYYQRFRATVADSTSSPTSCPQNRAPIYNIMQNQLALAVARTRGERRVIYTTRLCTWK